MPRELPSRHSERVDPLSERELVQLRL